MEITAAPQEKHSPEKQRENVAIVPIFTSAHRHRRNQYASLLYLPMELQFLICANLTYGDLQTLRRTNRFYRELINIDFIRACLGSIATDAELRFVCRTCNRYDPVGRRLVWPMAPRARSALARGRNGAVADATAGARDDPDDDEDDITEVDVPPPNYSSPKVPLTAHCADCAVRAGQLSPGEYVLMEGGERKVRICRWCGWPCSANWGKDVEDFWPRTAWQLHPRCAWIYQMVIVGYYLLVCIRSGVALVTYILLWRILPDEMLVIVPSIIGFLLMGVILAIIWIRGREVRTYHVVGSLEFSIMALGIPPLYVLIKHYKAQQDAAIIAAEVLLVTHLVTRLINVLGNIVLFFEYDVTKHHAPDIPPFRKLVINPLLSGLVFWTSPMALENMWIGRGKHPRHKSFRHGMVKAWKKIQKSFGEYLFTPAGPGM